MIYLLSAIYNIVFAWSSMPGISAYHLQYCNNKNVAITLTSDVLLFFLCPVWYILHFWEFFGQSLSALCSEFTLSWTDQKTSLQEVNFTWYSRYFQLSRINIRIKTYSLQHILFWVLINVNVYSDINVYISVNSFKLSIDD